MKKNKFLSATPHLLMTLMCLQLFAQETFDGKIAKIRAESILEKATVSNNVRNISYIACIENYFPVMYDF